MDDRQQFSRTDPAPPPSMYALGITHEEFAILKRAFLHSGRGGIQLPDGGEMGNAVRELMAAISKRTGIGFETYT